MSKEKERSAKIFDLLGMSFGAASNRLKKSLLFDFACRLELVTCHRCGDLIERIEDFSIEHKSAWENSNTPLELFFSLENIAFSHLLCNIGAAGKKKVHSSEKERSKANFKLYYSRHKDRWNEARNARRRAANAQKRYPNVVQG